MARADKILAKLQDLILSFPDAKLSMSWGKPHFKVGDKIFAGFGEIDGKPSLTLKLEPEHADTRLDSDARFGPSRYEGLVEMNVEVVTDWNEIRTFILESYRLTAPKKSLAKLGGSAEPSDKRARTTVAQAPARKGATKKMRKPRER